LLSGIEVEFGGRARPLLDLVGSWAQHVLRLYNERNTTFEQSPYAWGVWDLGAANIIREVVARALVENGLDDPPVLNAIDELFKSFTSSREVDWGRLMHEQRGTGWWWDRIPTSGPVLADYEEHSE
jgi:hypothetical protein